MKISTRVAIKIIVGKKDSERDEGSKDSDCPIQTDSGNFV